MLNKSPSRPFLFFNEQYDNLQTTRQLNRNGQLMKSIFNSLFLALLILIASAFQYVQAMPGTTKEMPAEVIIKNFVKELKGIELYFMLETIEDKKASLQKMIELQRYNTGKVPQNVAMMLPKPKADETSFAGEYPYSIVKINKEAGYLHMSQKGAEGTITKTYWNIDKTRKLVGTLYSLCTMVCEKHDLTFSILKGEKFEPYSPVEIPDEIFNPAYYLQDKKNTEALANDAWSIAMGLPEKGTSITIRLEGVDSNNKVFRGNCVKLTWKKEKAKFEIQPLSWCN